MRRTGLWLVLCGLGLGCESLTPTSPASVPARVVEAPTLTPPTIDPAVMAAAIRGGVRQRSANEGMFEVDAFLAALVVEDLRAARPSVTLTPVAADGLQVGYSIAGVREGSVYGAVGLLDGDVIESINGVVLAGPDQVAGAILGSERVAALQVTRAGVSSVRELRIVPGVAWSTLVAARSGTAPPTTVAEVAEVLDPGPADMSPEPAAAAVGGRPAATPKPTGKPSVGGSAHPSPGKPTSTGAASSGGGVSCAADGSCTIARREFDAAVADPDRLGSQVNLSQAAGGYRLSGIRAGSQVSQLGFRNGDVVKTINGTGTGDEFGLLALYAGLGSTSTYTVGFVRGGASQRKVIRIR